MPAWAPTACPDSEGFAPPRPFDLCLSHLPQSYGASVREYVEFGLINGYFIDGNLWIARDDLEPWLQDAGHSSHDPADPAYIAPERLYDHDRAATA